MYKLGRLSSANNLHQSIIHSEAIKRPQTSTETVLDSPSAESILDLSALRERLYETAIDVALGLGTVGAVIVKWISSAVLHAVKQSMSFSAASSRNDDSDLLVVLLVDVKACQGKEHRKEEKEEKAEVEWKDPGSNHILESIVEWLLTLGH